MSTSGQFGLPSPGPPRLPMHPPWASQQHGPTYQKSGSEQPVCEQCLASCEVFAVTVSIPCSQLDRWDKLPLNPNIPKPALREVTRSDFRAPFGESQPALPGLPGLLPGFCEGSWFHERCLRD